MLHSYLLHIHNRVNAHLPVKERMPTIDMFDDAGRFVPEERSKDEEDDKDEK